MQLPVIHSFPTWLHQTQTWMYTQVKYLPPDITPHIVCHRTANLEQFSVPHIHALSEGPKWRWYWEKGLRRSGIRHYIGLLVETARKHHVPIIHSHFGSYGWEDTNAAQRSGARHVVTFYGADVNRLPQQDPRWYDRYQKLFKHVNLVLCEGPHMGSCVEKLGCAASKIHVQHLGIEIERFPFQPRIWQPGEPLRILIASSFREKKGIPYGLEALARLQKDLPLEITILGDAGSDEPSIAEKKIIESVIEKHNLASCIRRLGYKPYDVLIEEAYKHHIYLAPSVTASDGDTEGGAPVTIIEMMASGMPVVSTTHCDIPHIITHRKNGLLASERNPEELYTCLLWLAENCDKWKDLTQHGRLHVEDAYDARKQGQLLGAHYRRLVE